MNTDPRQPNFDRVARIYRWAEYIALGPALQRMRTHFLPLLAECRMALVLGDGDGRFLAAFLDVNQEVTVTAVDTSRKMLDLLQNRCSAHMQRLRLKQGSALAHDPDSATDLIVSHFLLDCFTGDEVMRIAFNCATHCHAGTLWLVSDFGVPRNAALRLAGKLYVRALYGVFGILTGLRVRQLPDIASALRNTGFESVAYHESLGGLLFTQLWELKPKLHGPGAASQSTDIY